jgi:hypothetical protein
LIVWILMEERMGQFVFTNEQRINVGGQQYTETLHFTSDPTSGVVALEVSGAGRPLLSMEFTVESLRDFAESALMIGETDSVDDLSEIAEQPITPVPLVHVKGHECPVDTVQFSRMVLNDDTIVLTITPATNVVERVTLWFDDLDLVLNMAIQCLVESIRLSRRVPKP